MKKLFAFEGFLLLSGMVCGIIGYVVLPDELVLSLGEFLNGQMQNLRDVCSVQEAASRIVHANVLELLRVYLAGACLLGLPILVLLLFLKGFTFGFTGCFLLSHSFLLIIGRFFYLPVFAASAALAVRFSWMLLKSRTANTPRQLFEYSFVFVLLLLLALLVSYADGFCCARYLQELSA